jgi:hypothetical protein
MRRLLFYLPTIGRQRPTRLGQVIGIVSKKPIGGRDFVFVVVEFSKPLF